jgi:hypothetical protein
VRSAVARDGATEDGHGGVLGLLGHLDGHVPAIRLAAAGQFEIDAAAGAGRAVRLARRASALTGC